MHKQDTARLNAAAVGERIRALGLKQYLLAQQLGVDTHTVNRWLTGRVKRISRDNLDRLATALGAAARDLSHADETDVRATQVQQTEAAKKLLESQAVNLFWQNENYALYEDLLKAVMHPNMALRDLAKIYIHLSAAAANQPNLKQAREYAKLAQEYAQRCGDSQYEHQALDHLAQYEGMAGNLAAARRGLELFASYAESIGAAVELTAAQSTLIHVYRLLGQFGAALRTANACLAGQYGQLDAIDTDYTYTHAARILRDLGQFEAAKASAARAAKVLPVGRRVLRLRELFAADLDSLTGAADAAAGVVEKLLSELRDGTPMMEDYIVTPASVLRRAGKLDAAVHWIDEAQGFDWLGPYDVPFLDAEAARIAAARKDWRAAGQLRRKANSGFEALTMSKWICDDPALDVGQQFKPPRVRLKLPPQ